MENNSENFKMPQIPKIPSLSNVFFVIFILAAIFYFSRTIFTVQPNELAVIKRFGQYNRTVSSGLRYRLPEPFETATIVDVTNIRREELGFKTDLRNPGKFLSVPQEALMLTGDESIVNIEFIIQYRIKNVEDFVFKLRDVKETLRKSAESAMRQVIGSREIDDALNRNKAAIQNETMLILQDIMDKYNSGIQIVACQLQDVFPPQQVSAAFKDVTSAREDKNRFISEAEAYANEIIPQTKGEAAKIINSARGDAARIVNTAKGDTAKFIQMNMEYKQSPEITAKRLYYEKLTSSFSKDFEKIIIDSADKGIFELFKIIEGGRQGGVK
ncbi:MAG: FtsH protease activity modulator HflK [Candidatus Muiribacteriota bacterium]